jgi:hypothetical protein
VSAAVADRRASLWAALFGAATLAVYVGFAALEPVRAAIASGCGAPEMFTKFQLARSLNDLIAVFSAPAGACRGPIIAAMDAANRLDLYAFVPAYAAFLIAASIMLAGAWRTRLALAAIGAVIVAALADAAETATQLRITQDIEGAGAELAPLAIAFWMKYAAMGVHAALMAIIALSAPRRRLIVAAFAIIAALATIGAAFDAGRVPFMTLCFGLFWLSLLVTAAAGFVRPLARDASPA